MGHQYGMLGFNHGPSVLSEVRNGHPRAGAQLRDPHLWPHRERTRTSQIHRPPVGPPWGETATRRCRNGDAPKEIYGTCDDLWEIYGKCGPGLIWFPKSFFRSPIVGWFLKKYPIAVQPHCDMMMFGGFKNHTLMGLWLQYPIKRWLDPMVYRKSY